jgi:hypothetical protein
MKVYIICAYIQKKFLTINFLPSPYLKKEPLGKYLCNTAVPDVCSIKTNDTNMSKDKEKNSATGNKQSDFAGTNPDRYGAAKNEEEQNNPIDAREAQNVTEGERISGKEAEDARRKAKS